MTSMTVRDVSLYIKTVGQGDPLLLLHGGPGMDHTSLLPLTPLAEQFTLVFYDQRCNGRSDGAQVESMTFENLAADAEALRQALGFERWAVLGHSFGGMVALEYALRYPESLSHLILMDTCGESRWAQHNAPEMLRKRGYKPGAVQAAQRFFNGQIEPEEFFPTVLQFASAYYDKPGILKSIQLFLSGMQAKARPETQIFAFSKLLPGWSVMARLGEIETPTLVLAGRQDFQFPPEHQAILVDRLPCAQLALIDRAGHNAHGEQPTQVIKIIQQFLTKRSQPCPKR